MPNSMRAQASIASIAAPSIIFHRQLETRFIIMMPITMTATMARQYFRSSISTVFT